MTDTDGRPLRVRFAPSPTGYFHVGSGRTALFNWLFARGRGGSFLVRIEDTDVERNRPEWTDGIFRALEWLGLDWDEPPVFQSRRSDRYREAIDRLLAAGSAYACDCTPDQVRARAGARGGPPGYDGHCRDRGLTPGPGRLVRFRTPDGGSTTVVDLIRGEPRFEHATIEDFAVRKSSGDPLFLLANVVDDADMAVTHVIRGEDHLSNTPKYQLLWQALDLGPLPTFAHLPLLLNDQRKKLSKRRDRVAVEDFRDDGYLAVGIVNYLSLLGWAPAGDREILTRDELVSEFRLEDVKSAPAIFDERKLQAVNAEHVRRLDAAAFVEQATAWWRSRWEPLGALVQERARTFAEAVSMVEFLHVREPAMDEAAWTKLVAKQPAFGAIVTGARDRLDACPWEVDAIRVAVVEAGEAAGVPQLGKAQAPVRLAVTGRDVGPPLFEAIHALGRLRAVARLDAALTRLGSG